MRLIDAEYAKYLVKHFGSMLTWSKEDIISEIIRHIDKDAIDAEPVRHGQWEKMGEADYKCSVCGFRFTTADHIEMFPYCRCGAKMDEEVE